MTSFKQAFERSVNDDMRDHSDDSQPGPSPPEAADEQGYFRKFPSSPPREHEDYNRYERKKEPPPRFSTLFASAPPPSPTPPAVREYQREHHRARQPRSGLFIPMPLFIFLAVVLFVETTILFTYTIIGLYNNAPSRLFPWAGPGTAALYRGGQREPSVNVAPNFIIPAAAAAPSPVTEYITLTAPPDRTVTTIASETSSTTSRSTIDPSFAASVMASMIAGLAPTTTSSTPVVVVTIAPSRSTVHAVTVITKDPSGNIITASDASSVPTDSSAPSSSSSPTATPPSTPTADPDLNSSAWASISSELAEASQDLTRGLIPPAATLLPRNSIV